MRGVPPAKNIDAYIAAAPVAVRARLKRLHAIVRKAMPRCEESISYGMPCFKKDRARVHFGLFKNHIGFFPGAVVKDFARELEGYEIAKGTVRLPLDGPLPAALIGKLIAAALAPRAPVGKRQRRS